MKNIDQKMIAGAVILLAWGGLVVGGYAPAAEYVSVLRDTLIGLGAFKMITTAPPK